MKIELCYGAAIVLTAENAAESVLLEILGNRSVSIQGVGSTRDNDDAIRYRMTLKFSEVPPIPATEQSPT